MSRKNTNVLKNINNRQISYKTERRNGFLMSRLNKQVTLALTLTLLKQKRYKYHHIMNNNTKLINGKFIPCIGYGTWQTPNGEVAYQTITDWVYAFSFVIYTHRWIQYSSAKNNITVKAWSPPGNGRMLQHHVLCE